MIGSVVRRFPSRCPVVPPRWTLRRCRAWREPPVRPPSPIGAETSQVTQLGSWRYRDLRPRRRRADHVRGARRTGPVRRQRHDILAGPAGWIRGPARADKQSPAPTDSAEPGESGIQLPPRRPRTPRRPESAPTAEPSAPPSAERSVEPSVEPSAEPSATARPSRARTPNDPARRRANPYRPRADARYCSGSASGSLLLLGLACLARGSGSRPPG